MPKCEGCGEEVTEVCQDGYCRPCHKSVSWEDCTTRTDAARICLELGHPLEDVRQLFPNAKV